MHAGLSEDEINSMMKDAEANADADKQRRELVEAKNNAEAMVHSTEKQLAEHGDKVDASIKSDIEAAMADLTKAAESEDLEDIQAKTQALMQASCRCYGDSEGFGVPNPRRSLAQRYRRGSFWFHVSTDAKMERMSATFES